MALFKCKMCGGALEICENESVMFCQYCGTKQTLPRLDDERRANLYDRANHFRRSNEFDKAMTMYETILSEDSNDAEAYWSIVLCRYGIEYVEDPVTRRRVPTVNRMQYTSVLADEDYKAALAYADGRQREVYEAEAHEIDRLQKEILAISQKESPFDVFICYKETDKNGRRTPDSVLAQELYYGLKNEGFHVFFSRITLEDKLGSAYEPYIFAALNSAKVMVVLGTRPEHFSATWVKNEWSRYLALIAQGQKKTLIPAYRDMDPYDLPEEFSHLQAQDMSKLGFMQDMIRGIKKIAKTSEPKLTVIKETISSAAPNVTALLKRAALFLEDGDFERADDFFEQVLNQDPENGNAYLGKLLVELSVRDPKELRDLAAPFNHSGNYQKAIRFGDDALKSKLIEDIEYIQTRNENARLEWNYRQGVEMLSRGTTEQILRNAATVFSSISGYRDADTLAEECLARAECARKDAILASATGILANKAVYYREAIRRLEEIRGWKNADELIAEYEATIEELFRKEEEARLAREHEEKIKEERARRKRTVRLIVVLSIIGISVLTSISLLLYTLWIRPSIKYHNAVKLMDQKEYAEAYEAFDDIGYFKDSKEKKTQIENQIDNYELPKLLKNGKYEKAAELAELIDHPDASVYKDIVDGEYHLLCTEFGMTSIVIPKGTKTLDSYEFSNCTTLKTITIPNSVEKIGWGAFSNCSSLTDIYYEGSSSEWDEICPFYLGYPSSFTIHYNYNF